VNKTGQFPDFHDILSLVKSVQSDVNMKPENLRRIGKLNSENFVSSSVGVYELLEQCANFVVQYNKHKVFIVMLNDQDVQNSLFLLV